MIGDGEGCRSHHIPWADGTRCGEDKVLCLDAVDAFKAIFHTGGYSCFINSRRSSFVPTDSVVIEASAGIKIPLTFGLLMANGESGVPLENVPGRAEEGYSEAYACVTVLSKITLSLKLVIFVSMRLRCSCTLEMRMMMVLISDLEMGASTASVRE